MSVGKQLYSTRSIWHASILHYLYGAESLAKVIHIDKFKSEWSFAVPVCDAEIDIASYEKNELTLSSAKGLRSLIQPSFAAATTDEGTRRRPVRQRGMDKGRGWLMASTRQNADRKQLESAPEAEASQYTRSGLTGDAYENAAYRSVRDRQVIDANKPAGAPLSPETRLSDLYLAQHNQRLAETAAKEAEAYATGKKVNAQERRIAEAIAEAKAADARLRASRLGGNHETQKI